MCASSSTTRTLPSSFISGMEGKGDAKFGAALRQVVGVDAAAVRLHDLVADGQAEADARFAAGRLDGGAAEVLEELRAFARRNAGALVADGDGAVTRGHRGCDRDGRARRREL